MSCDAPLEPDGEWVVDESMSCPREDEGYMVQGNMADSRFYPENIPEFPEHEKESDGDA